MAGLAARAFEKVFQHTSRHRVQGGSNEQYLDRNHGSILIAWDRLNTWIEAQDIPGSGPVTGAKKLKGGVQNNVFLIERGLIKPGEVLVDRDRRFNARVRADGSLISAEHRGSIHSVAAQVQGAPACNGWAFWHVERQGRLVLIDSLRQQLRSEMAP